MTTPGSGTEPENVVLLWLFMEIKPLCFTVWLAAERDFSTQTNDGVYTEQHQVPAVIEMPS